ncbi:hypothetical protein KIW84_053589 [Lathyrus oleraceus]|uniref:Uncharacterized protein n=1 Tax=Pisum sativum TaxID=3888 RepID=A0A9D5ADH2_PEA|nr:hypothetical protein KIW84_053589 [Pisum sativum]
MGRTTPLLFLKDNEEYDFSPSSQYPRTRGHEWYFTITKWPTGSTPLGTSEDERFFNHELAEVKGIIPLELDFSEICCGPSWTGGTEDLLVVESLHDVWPLLNFSWIITAVRQGVPASSFTLNNTGVCWGIDVLNLLLCLFCRCSFCLFWMFHVKQSPNCKACCWLVDFTSGFRVASIIATLYTIQNATGSAAITRVSNALGAGHPQAARLFVYAARTLFLMITALQGTRLMVQKVLADNAFGLDDDVDRCAYLDVA